MASSGWRWYSFIVQVLKQQQQKKKMEKKRQKKKKDKKKASLRMGTICSLETPDAFRSIGGYFLCIVFVLCSQGQVLSPRL